MADWIGLIFLALLIGGAIMGLKVLSRPRVSTEDEFEIRSSESTSMLNAGINALNEAINPEAAKGKEVQMQMKDGTFRKKKREGKAGGSVDDEEL